LKAEILRGNGPDETRGQSQQRVKGRDKHNYCTFISYIW